MIFRPGRRKDALAPPFAGQLRERERAGAVEAVDDRFRDNVVEIFVIERKEALYHFPSDRAADA